MFGFEIVKRSSRSKARIGILRTPHGEVETPAFVPVGTRASVKTLDSSEVAEAGSQVLIMNTFHLHLTPGESIVRAAGGLHSFMRWDKPIMTDSGGFQVLSFGFGREHSTGAVKHVLKDERIEGGAKPSTIKITEDGVEFRSPRNGEKLFIGPRESIAIQESLGADIILAFDEATSPLSEEAYMRESLERTHRWAKVCLQVKSRADQALYGIVQGSEFPHLREESAKVLGAMDFQGYGIGGEYGVDKEAMAQRIGIVTDLLPEDRPRHVLGVGHPEDFEPVARGGGDTFDCIAPTHYARHGTVFTSEGRLNLRRSRFLHEHMALDASCSCPVCSTYSRAYLSHLFRAGEVTALKLATLHNVYYFNRLAAKLRDDIASGML
jgi:queuine tRNA-ribosyltransferase